MKRILIFYYYSNFHVVRIDAVTKHYITMESIFPIAGVKADYFDESEDFYLDYTLPILKQFACSVMHRYQQLIVPGENYYKILVQEPYITENNWAKLLSETKEFLIGMYYRLDFKFISATVYKDLIKQHLSFAKADKTDYEYASYCGGGIAPEKTLEVIHSKIIQTKVDRIYFFHYYLDDFFGLNHKYISLALEDIAEERLLQELVLCYFSEPQIARANPFEGEYFDKRFNSFHDQKKLSLFMVSSTNKELFLYNKHIAKFMINRH